MLRYSEDGDSLSFNDSSDEEGSTSKPKSGVRAAAGDIFSSLTSDEGYAGTSSLNIKEDDAGNRKSRLRNYSAGKSGDDVTVTVCHPNNIPSHMTATTSLLPHTNLQIPPSSAATNMSAPEAPSATRVDIS